MPEQVLKYEPELALFSPEEDPLIFYKKILEFAEIALTEKGQLFLELNEFRASEIQYLVKALESFASELIRDINGKERILWVNKANV